MLKADTLVLHEGHVRSLARLSRLGPDLTNVCLEFLSLVEAFWTVLHDRTPDDV